VIADLFNRRGAVSARALIWACMMATAVPLGAVAADSPPSVQPGASAPAVPERGIHRSALLVSLLGGQSILTLEPRASQPPDVVDALRLDESVAFAMKNNFEVLAMQAKNDAADWEVVGAYGAYLPTVSFTRAVGTERSAPAAYNIDNERVRDDKHIRRDKTLSIRQPIVDLALISDILLRHGRQTAAELEQLGTRERVALQTVNAFFKIIRAQLSLRFAQEYKAELDRLTEMMGSRVEGGGAAQADLDRIKTRTVTAESAIIETRSEYDSAVDEFRRLTGVMPQKLEIPASLVPTPPESVDVALERALHANPEYQLSMQQIDVQKRERDKSYSRLLPKVNLDFTKSRTWNAGGAALGSDPASGLDEVFPYQNETRAMVTTTWSITGGTEIAEGLAAQAKAREANFKSLDTRNRTEEAVRLSFNALNAAQSRVGVLERALESNAKVVAAFQEQYFNANRPLFDLLDAFERQYGARLDLTRLLTSEAQAGHQLRRQMGELVPALKESEPRARPAAE
jgi:Outer membrane protein